jgi:hypothetical protein
VQQLRGDDVILAGNYIELGLNNSGSVIDNNSTSYGGPTGIYGSSGLDTSAQSTRTLSAATTATGGQVGIAQSVSFDANSGFIDFGVSLTNTGTTDLTNPIYARGLDPDQDVYIGGPYDT